MSGMRRKEDKGWSSNLYCVTSAHIYIYSIKPLLVGFIDLPLTTLNLANILQCGSIQVPAFCII